MGDVVFFDGVVDAVLVEGVEDEVVGDLGVRGGLADVAAEDVVERAFSGECPDKFESDLAVGAEY